MSRKKTAEQKPCLCSELTVCLLPEQVEQVPSKHRGYLLSETPDEAGWVYLQTGCEEQVWGTFAPGHDARTAGLLQTADRAGGQATLDGSVWASGVNTAARVSEALAAKVAATPAPKKARAKKADEPKATRTVARVGRWTYEGKVDATGKFHYRSKKGTDEVAEAGKWTPAEQGQAAA